MRVCECVCSGGGGGVVVVVGWVVGGWVWEGGRSAWLDVWGCDLVC